MVVSIFIIRISYFKEHQFIHRITFTFFVLKLVFYFTLWVVLERAAIICKITIQYVGESFQSIMMRHDASQRRGGRESWREI